MAEIRYHIGRNGLPAVCKAKIQCRLGGEHFDDMAEALRAAEKLLSEENKQEPLKKNPAKIEVANKRITASQKAEYKKVSKDLYDQKLKIERDLVDTKENILRIKQLLKSSDLRDTLKNELGKENKIKSDHLFDLQKKYNEVIDQINALERSNKRIVDAIKADERTLAARKRSSFSSSSSCGAPVQTSC